MSALPVSYKRHRFPRELIARAVWLCHCFALSFRLVEEMLLERGIVVSHETIRRWGRKFGHAYARGLRRKPARPGDIRKAPLPAVLILLRLGWFTILHTCQPTFALHSVAPGATLSHG